jgi:hypothetical protein
MRRTAGGALLLLAACSQAEEAARPDADDLIDCALSGAAAFARDCWIERAGTIALPMRIVRQPDGGFRRFHVMGDSQELVAADGAEIARVSRAAGGFEVSIGADRYRFPTGMIGDAGP